MNRFLLIVLLMMFKSLYALDWQDLWVNKNRQAQSMMEHGDFAKASKVFEREDWRATAAFRARDYKQAALRFGALNTSDALFNAGNAWAYLGDYKKALDAYDKSLKINKKNHDAIYNRAIVEKLLKKEQNKKDQQKKDQAKQDQKKQDQAKQDQGKQDQEKQDQEKQDQEKQDQGKQDQGKQDQGKQDQEKQDQAKQDQEKQDQKKQDQAKRDQSQQDQAEREQQMQQQSLDLIPDDPGGLLREKFRRDYLQRHQEEW